MQTWPQATNFNNARIFVVHKMEYARKFIEAEVACLPFPFAMFVFGVPVSSRRRTRLWPRSGFYKPGIQTSSPVASAPPSDAGSDPGRSSEASLWHEEAKLHSREFVDEQHGRMIGGVAFLDDVGWDHFPLAVFQVLPLIRAIFTDPETES